MYLLFAHYKPDKSKKHRGLKVTKIDKFLLRYYYVQKIFMPSIKSFPS